MWNFGFSCASDSYSSFRSSHFPVWCLVFVGAWVSFSGRYRHLHVLVPTGRRTEDVRSYQEWCAIYIRYFRTYYWNVHLFVGDCEDVLAMNRLFHLLIMCDIYLKNIIQLA